MKGAQKSSSELWTSTKKLIGVANAFVHWKKHGADFPELNHAKQYVEVTKKFLNSPPKGTLTKIRSSNDDVIRYNENTNTFGVMTKEGIPRTMFKPDPSKHGYPTNLEYFNDQ